jgi:hypothetical protein
MSLRKFVLPAIALLGLAACANVNVRDPGERTLIGGGIGAGGGAAIGAIIGAAGGPPGIVAGAAAGAVAGGLFGAATTPLPPTPAVYDPYMGQ